MRKSDYMSKSRLKLSDAINRLIKATEHAVLAKAMSKEDANKADELIVRFITIYSRVT